MFDSKSNIDDMTRKWFGTAVSGATYTYSWQTSSTILTATATTGSKYTRSAKQRGWYQPGKSQQIMFTFTMGTPDAKLAKRVGYFDDLNGIFVKYTNDWSWAVRNDSGTVGTPTLQEIPRTAWNYDKFDGTGPSGITLDATKSQIGFIWFEWLGVGTISVGFIIDEIPYHAHHFQNSNVTSGVYMRQPNLPVSYEIENLGGSAGGTLEFICATVISEGGYEVNGMAVSYPIATPFSVLAGPTYTPILKIQPRITLANTNRNYCVLRFSEIAIAAVGADLVELVLVEDATTAGGTVATFGMTSQITTGFTYTAGTGTIVNTSYVSGNSQNKALVGQSIDEKELLMSVWDFANSQARSFTLLGRSMGATMSVYASPNVKEIC